jgi:SH3-like domain-containing protein
MKKTTRLLIAVLVALGTGATGAQRMTVSSNIGNVRSGPGTTHGVMWQVEKYHPVVIIEKSGNWYRFADFEGDRGWIHKSLLDDTAAVITNQEQNNIRSGPGTNHDIVFTVEKGVPFKILGRKGNWIHVEHADGDSGWIHQSLVW